MSVQVWSNDVITCLSSDTKPTSGVAASTRAYETNTGNWFILNSAGSWVAYSDPGATVASVAALGAVADAAVTNPASSASVIAALKGVLSLETDVKNLLTIRSVQGTFAAEAAGDYADNDVISNAVANGTGLPITFANAVLSTGGSAKIIGATLTMSEDSVAGTTELILFSATPTATEMDDNAAYGGVGAADGPLYLGSIAFPALVDVGATSFVAATAPTAAAPLLIRAAATSIFGILVWRDAEANETAGMTVTITLYIQSS